MRKGVGTERLIQIKRAFAGGNRVVATKEKGHGFWGGKKNQVGKRAAHVEKNEKKRVQPKG